MSQHGPAHRRARLWAELGEHADAVLVCEPRHVTYEGAPQTKVAATLPR